MTGQCLTAVPKGKSSVVNLQLCDEEKREEQREEEGSVAAAAISTTQQWVVTEVKKKKPAADIAAAATTAAVGVGKAAGVGVVAYTIESVAQPGMCVDAAPAGPVAPPCKPPKCTPGAPATASIQVREKCSC
jgi:hypothetical protein